MRFRFCGDLEAPSWVLHEITTLSEISSVRLKLLVKQVLSQMLSGSLDYDKVLKFSTPKGSPVDMSVTKGTLAAIHFVIANAAKYDVDEETLAKEIEQLGLPRENALAILRPYGQNKTALRAKFGNDTFGINRAKKIDVSKHGDGYRIVVTCEGDNKLQLHLTEAQFPVFLHDMEQALALMEAVGSDEPSS